MRRTLPVCWKSTPSTTPIGWAVTKLPEHTRIHEPCIGELGRPIESSASICARNEPAASFTCLRGLVVGDAYVLVESARKARPLQARIDLAAPTVNQHQAYTEAVQQRDVVNDVREGIVLRDGVPQHQHEGLAPVCVDVGCSVPQPADMGPRRRCHALFQAVDK